MIEKRGSKRNSKWMRSYNLKLQQEVINIWESGQVQYWEKTKKKKKNYIQEIIKSDLEEAGQEDVFRKIKKDFQAASISVEEKEIRNQMEKALSRAKEDFKK